jgi:uncharacterized protein
MAGAEHAGAEHAGQIRQQAERIAAAGGSAPRAGRDPVNLSMIRNWAEAIGDENPVYTEAAAAAASPHRVLVAPPAMAQVWTMPGLRGTRGGDDPLGLASALLDAAGYPAVVATNCDQEYRRYLRHGEQVSVSSRLLAFTGPKRTALGEGWFVTTRSTWTVSGEVVATMDFRILKYRPDAATGRAEPAGPVLRPPVSSDTEFFWAGTRLGELRIQQCSSCRSLRHPPGPLCPHCGSTDHDYFVAAGIGHVYSYVVHHHPPVPGREAPFTVALVELPEGVRIVAELIGIRRDQVSIGMPVEIGFHRIDDELTLPVWRPDAVRPSAGGGSAGRSGPDSPAGSAGGRASRSGGEAAGGPGGGQARTAGTGHVAETLPELVIDITPTFVIASAIATRDFQPVHHDPDRARAGGGSGIFLNILTTTGLIQRFVSQWAGPHAVFRAISIRLGVPCYAGDTLTFTGQVAERRGDSCALAVTGQCSLGAHVTATVTIDRPGASA